MWSFLVYFCESVNKNIFEWVSTIYILNEDKDGLTETGLLWMENVSTILKQENDTCLKEFSHLIDQKIWVIKFLPSSLKCSKLKVE